MRRAGARKQPEWSLPERREQRRDRGREHADDDHEGAGRADMIHYSGDGLAEVQWHGDASTLENPKSISDVPPGRIKWA
jgi:hypothetical protein